MKNKRTQPDGKNVEDLQKDFNELVYKVQHHIGKMPHFGMLKIMSHFMGATNIDDALSNLMTNHHNSLHSEYLKEIYKKRWMAFD